MVKRRSVLKIGATTVAGALVKMPVFGRNLPPARTCIAFQRVVFDQRFAECRGFASELQSAGSLISLIRGDVAKLWYDDLRAHLSENRLPIAGLTDRSALFCLEELARDVGMRVVFRVDHILDQTWDQTRDQTWDQTGDTNGHAQHTAVGLSSLIAATSNLTAKPGFGRTMARLFSQFDMTEPRDTAAQKVTGPFSPENKTALVSWLIA